MIYVFITIRVILLELDFNQSLSVNEYYQDDKNGGFK